MISEVIIETVRECKLEDLQENQKHVNIRSMRYCDYLWDKVAKQMCREMLSTVLRQQVNSILSSSKQAIVTDPFIYFVGKICTKLCTENSTEIVRSALKDVTYEYIEIKKQDEILTRNIFNTIIREFATQSYDECIIERIGESLIDRQIYRVVEPVCLKFIEEISDKEDREIMESMFQSYLEKQVQNSRLEEILNGAEKTNFEKIADRVLQSHGEIDEIEDSLLNDFKFEE
jgi:hypothetical protein